MNKIYLAAIVTIVAMLGFTYVAMDIKGGLNDDIVNQLAILGAVVLVIATVFVVTKYVRQMQTDKATGSLAEENWDGIGEYKNELPFGWAVIFLLTMIWAMWYFLAGYPVSAYSQIGEWNEEVTAKNAVIAEKAKDLTPNERLHLGKAVFNVQCAPCHGLNGKGQENYATGELRAENLNKRSLSETYVSKVIREGSTQLGYAGGMPPMMLQDEADIKAVSKYIAGGLKGEQPAQFAVCASCHGMNGEGMDFVAPSLTAYNVDLVKTLLTSGSKKGEIGRMPSERKNLTDLQIELVSEFVANGPATELEE